MYIIPNVPVSHFHSQAVQNSSETTATHGIEKVSSFHLTTAYITFNNAIQKIRGAGDSPSKNGKLPLKDLKEVLGPDRYNNLLALEKEKKEKKKANRNSRSSFTHKEVSTLRHGSIDALRVSLLARSMTERQT